MMNDWMALSVATVVHHVSDPYKRTAFMFELKILILVFLLISLVFHTFFRRLNAVLALLILDLMSFSYPPVVLTLLPRYVNPSTSSIVPSFSLIGLVALV